MVECWNDTPDDRPSFVELVDDLEDLMQEEAKANRVSISPRETHMWSERSSSDVFSVLRRQIHLCRRLLIWCIVYSYRLDETSR